MNKKILLCSGVFVFICLAVFIFLIIGIYAIFNDIFPKAEKVNYPDYSLVESITVSKDEEPIYISREDCKVLYEYISTAKPTRKMTSNETPDTTSFFTVNIKASDMLVYEYGYIYQENGVFYYEIPYVGIYKLKI